MNKYETYFKDNYRKLVLSLVSFSSAEDISTEEIDGFFKALAIWFWTRLDSNPAKCVTLLNNICSTSAPQNHITEDELSSVFNKYKQTNINPPFPKGFKSFFAIRSFQRNS